MEQLRFIPVMMFLAGVTLIYAGFKNKTPIDVIRDNVGGLTTGNNTPDGATSTVAFTPNANPLYVGTVVYNSPGSGLRYPGTFS